MFWEIPMPVDFTSLRVDLEAKMHGMIRSMYEAFPMGRYFRDAPEISRDIFLRHTIQTILRIRLARVADAKTLVLLTKTNPRAAQLWARYADEEMLHDRLFLRDIQKMGATEQSVYSTQPFLATQLLQGFIYYTLEHEGPLGLLAKAYFLEFVSFNTQKEWNKNLERALGEGAIDGAKAHIDVDGDEDHIGSVWNVVTMEIHDEADVVRLHRYIDTYYLLFTAYLQELATAHDKVDIAKLVAQRPAATALQEIKDQQEMVMA
jgi:hypothetical protein